MDYDDGTMFKSERTTCANDSPTAQSGLKEDFPWAGDCVTKGCCPNWHPPDWKGNWPLGQIGNPVIVC